MCRCLLGLQKITLIQNERCTVDAGSIIERVKNGMQFASIINLFVRGCTANGRFYAARGFGVTKRTTYIRYRMERRDWYTLSYLTILFIASSLVVAEELLSESRIDFISAI